MNQNTFITLLVVGAVVGAISMLIGKGPKLSVFVYFGVSIGGAFLGWWILRQISGTSIEVGFAIGGSLALLSLLRLFKR